MYKMNQYLDQVWAIATLEQVLQFQAVASGKCACTCVAFSADSERCVTGFEDGNLRLFDLSKIDIEAKFAPHSCRVSAIVFSTDGWRRYFLPSLIVNVM